MRNSVLSVSLLALAVAAVLGLWVGSHAIPAPVVWEALTSFDPTNTQHLIVRHSRVPRVLLGLVVGSGLGLAGAIMQTLTRNPLADPGLLGVNAGASTAVVIAIAFFGITSVQGYVWFAFLGAALASVVVYRLGTGPVTTPARLALAGAALTMALSSVTGMIVISHEAVFNRFRFWTVGSLQGRDVEVVGVVTPFILVGMVLALSLGRVLNTLSLGDDSATALGVNIKAVRAFSFLAIILLAGAATAAAGPVSFVGLAAPHIVRLIVGADNRAVLSGTLVAAPALLLLADAIGKAIVAPGELQTGIMTALVGAPVFILLLRTKRVVAL